KTKMDTHRNHVLTRDFQVLTEAPVIVERLARTPAWRHQAVKPNAFTLQVPGNSPVYRKLWGGSAVFLMVPVDEELEALGRLWCKSQDLFERIEGAKMLGHFKNHENVELLK